MRAMRTRILALSSVAALAASCVIGAPPGFSSGDLWVAPLINPLEDDVLLVPVSINGGGPYVFKVDPSLGTTAVDSNIASEHDLYRKSVVNVQTHDDNLKKLAFVEAREINVGDLKVSNRVVMVMPENFKVGGRTVQGILGRDVIAPSLVFAVDRDRGTLTIATQGNLGPPAGASSLGFKRVAPHDLVDVTINKQKTYSFHLDMGTRKSALWPEHISASGLPRQAQPSVVRDEYGFPKQVDQLTVAAIVNVGKVESNGLSMTPFADKRFTRVNLDGELGQNFFFPFHVTANWHKKTVWLKRREAELMGTAKERIRRWGKTFDGCTMPACTKVEIHPIFATPQGGAPAPAPASPGPAPEATKPSPPDNTAAGPVDTTPPDLTPPDATPPSPAPVRPAEDEVTVPAQKRLFTALQIKREGDAAKLTFEVVLMAVDKDGRSVGAPNLRATLPSSMETVFHRVSDPAYSKAEAFVVVDVSPFPQPCQRAGGGYRCVWPAE
jgi:hypothetical protein